MPNTIAVLASGGLDSSIMLSLLLRQGRTVQPLYIRSQLVWEPAERAALTGYLASQSGPNLRPLVTLDLPVTDLYGDHWSTTGAGTPHRHSPDAEVFLPHRNLLLTVKSAIWCQLRGISELALAVLGASPFPDAKSPFFDRLRAVWECCSPSPLGVVLPFAAMDKRQVMELGRTLPLELTFSCIAPVSGRHCGRCNKCAERQTAFHEAGLDDPTPYAEQP